MSRQELLEGYLDGQLSRRVFIRRLVATGVSAAAALSYASILEGQPASAAALGDFYIAFGDHVFPALSELQLAQGEQQALNNHGPSTHNVRDTSGVLAIDSGKLQLWQGTFIGSNAAGTFSFRCDDEDQAHPSINMKGKFQVPILTTPAQGRKGSPFTIRWATNRAGAGLVYDVQRQAPGQNGWREWRTGVKAAATIMRPAKRGRYRFRARVRKPSTGRKSGWSPTATIRAT